MLGIVPGEVSGEVSRSLAIIQEPPRVFRSALDGAEGRFDEWIVVGRPRPREQLRHAVVFAEPLDRLGLHLTATVVDDFWPLILGQVEDVLIDQSAFEQQLGFLGGLRPGDAPMDGLAGPLVEQQVQEEVLTLLVGHQVTDVPAPALVGAGEFLADRSLRVAVVSSPGAPGGREAFSLENPVDARERGLKQALVRGCHG